MDLSLFDSRIFGLYSSNSQRVRRLSERWFGEEMFCPACNSDELDSFKPNHPVADFYCPGCGEEYQLKSQKTGFGRRILDGAYSTMINAIHNETQPNFFLLQYDPLQWTVSNLLIIPKFFFTESVIEQRKPLSGKARRAGWVGCNILLSEIPLDGRIPVVKDFHIQDNEKVRSYWKRVSFLSEKKSTERSWIVDIMHCIEELNKESFTLDEIYTFEEYLSKHHPNNRNIKPKIRQQLQYLRDKKYLRFQGKGRYQLKK